ncbi:hypothetical protein RJ55_07729 [Drechmeria coniospora]|nr:hypothetical protein RJ55_07729 [Drechmeria coniospora]
MVAGMTPTTASWTFVSAIMNSGYHVELAGGGLHNVEQLTFNVRNLVNSVPVGRGICINIIYANPKQLRWQIPLIQKLRSEGVPIDGLAFGAGVPSINVAKEFVELGFRYLSFKPGSAFAIKQVIAIAQLNKTYPVLMQWTGGRGGGHHSYEDFHEPILKLYGSVRRCNNIVLLAGSGFGGAQDSYPYLSGKWSIPFGRPPMPFDGILLGSRMMIAAEAQTSRGCKEAIVAAPGVDDESSWEQSYLKPTGGIITVKSEMGEPIHKVATRGVMLWKELDDKIFSITDKAKRCEKLRGMKSYIIQRLNDDFQKVWFGLNGSGKAADLEDMTYAQVLHRLVQLLFVSKESRWIDSSYMMLTVDFVRRMYGRLLPSMPQLEKGFGLVHPPLAVPIILKQCPKAEKQLINYSDARYFVLLCKRPGQKPPPFLVDMGDDFEVWFKKDSLWQSEDLATVVGEDAGRTCILQAPVAAKHAVVVDEPAEKILGSINSGYVARILKDRYGNDPSRVPSWRSESTASWTASPAPPHCLVFREGNKTHYHVTGSAGDDQVPDTEQWLRVLAGRPGSWMHALLTCEYVCQDSHMATNPVRRALSPAQEMHVEVTEGADPEELVLAVLELGSKSAHSDPSTYSLVIRKEREILVTFFANESVEGDAVPLTFRFTYHPEMALYPIHEIMEGRKDLIRAFYYRLWFGSVRDDQDQSLETLPTCQARRSYRCGNIVADTDASLSISLYTGLVPQLGSSESCSGPAMRSLSFGQGFPADGGFRGCRVSISAPMVQDFKASISQATGKIWSGLENNTVPLDFAIVVAWNAMMRAIFPSVIDGDFLQLVHLSNKFEVINDSAPLCQDDQVNTCAKLMAIRNEAAGRVVKIEATVERKGTPIIQLVSEFLFRGCYTDEGICFEIQAQPGMCIKLDSPVKLAVLKSKSWIEFADTTIDLLGQTVIFTLTSVSRHDAGSKHHMVHTYGQVRIKSAGAKRQKVIAAVCHEEANSSTNAVMDYLRRHGSPTEVIHQQANPQRLGEPEACRISVPAANHGYSRASGDYNPIHVSLPFARYANLPGTITHGMLTSAAVRQVVEKAAGVNERVRMRSYKAVFVDMVLPGDRLEVQVQHSGMKSGQRMLLFSVINADTGAKVVDGGDAEVDQPPSAYVFTGQGSFRISEIVKNNPKQLTVHFGGARGRKIRQNYMDMTVESDGEQVPLFGRMTPTTAKHSFRHGAGLLYSTEFAQAALAVNGHAQFLHLRSKGVVDAEALFAGHSLGEYTALSTIGAMMPFDKLLSVVFYRGLCMQSAVPRDVNGRSDFSLMAVNPRRMQASMTTESLQALVGAIAAATGCLLELVNHNVAGQQYVAAGSLAGLDCLSRVADHMARHAADFDACQPEAAAKAEALVAACAEDVAQEARPIRLGRGVATTPLEGIDVPFHSRFLLPQMPAFRRVLQRYITAEAIDARRLVGKYVSNVTGKEFDVSHEAVREVYEMTGSEVLGDLLLDFEGRC